MHEKLEKSKIFSVLEKLKTFKTKLDRFHYLPNDDINRYPHQYPAHGLAVSSLVFSLLHVFTFGLLPPFACFAIVGSLISFLKGNRRLTVFVAFLLGVFGLIFSSWLRTKLGGFVENPDSFFAFFA